MKLVDSGAPASGASGASFAWVNANRKLPREYFDLNVTGMREHRALARETGESGWLRSDGNLILAREDSEKRELRERVERLRRWGYEARWVTEDDARELEPGVRFPGSGEIAYFPDEFWVDAPALSLLLVRLARRAGARTRFGDGAARIARKSGAVQSVSLESGETLRADAVVNACGSRAPEVAAMAGSPLEIEVKSGLLARVARGERAGTKAEETGISRLLHTPRVNLRPEPTGGLLLHHDSVDRMMWDGRGEPEELSEVLLQRARELVPALEEFRVEEARVGFRPVPEDGLPCVGAAPGPGGYYEAVTHSGVTLGPLVGRLLAREIVAGEPDESLERFSPYRFTHGRP